MKKLLLVVLVFFLALNVSRAEWEHFTTYFPWTLFAVDFVDEDLGYAVGEQGSVLKTIDAAVTWDVVHSVPGVWFTAIHAFSADVLVAVGTYGSIWRTADGGVTWNDWSIPMSLPDSTFEHFRDVTYNPDIVRWVVVGYNGAYYEVQGPAGTATKKTHIPWSMHSIKFDPSGNNENGIIAATDGRIYRTTNNGTSWIYMNIQLTMGIWDLLNSVTYFDENRAVIVGNNGRILRTVNAGFTWTDIVHGHTTKHLRNVDAVFNGSGFTMIAVGDEGIMLKSINGGNAWTKVDSSTANHLYGVSLPTADDGYAVGEVGTGTYATTLLTNNLSVSITPISNIVPEQYSLDQNYPNPFNPSTTIRFAIPQASVVKLSVYDISGKLIKELVNENMNAGTYSYAFDASGFTSGTYFYRIESNNFVDTKKMILLK